MNVKYSKDHTVYYNSKNEEVPSATTILKILNKPALSKWANYLGFKHQNVDCVLNEAAEFGTYIHDNIHNFFLGKEFDLGNSPLGVTDAYGALRAFRDWYDNNSVEMCFTEKQFTSDLFGGTIDFYGKVNDKHTIIDFKTSKKIRLSMFLQLALYTILLEKHGYIVEQVGIVLCNGQHKDIKYMLRSDIDKYIEIATLLVDLFHKVYNVNEEEKWGEIFT